MKKAVILARVSTKRQEEEGLSLKQIQLPVLRKYASENGFSADKKDEFVFQESADQKIRKKFDQMIEYVKKNKDISAIITYRVDRITRNFRDAVDLDHLRLEYDKEIHFVNDHLVINKNSTGRDIQDWDLKVFLAKQTINRLKDDERISRNRKLKNGELPGKAPFGYLNITKPDKKKWIIPDDFQSIVVKKIFSWYVSENYSILEISKKLKKEYNISKSKSGVHFILTKKFYIGVIEYDGKEYPHNYERIIDEDDFYKAHALLNKRNQRTQPFKYAGKPFAYRGLIVCKKCGCRITPELKKKKLANGKFNEHVYYRCTNYHRKHKKLKYVKESTLDDQFVELFINLKIPPDKLEQITTTLKNSHKDAVYFFTKEFKYLNGEIKRLEKRTKKAYENQLDGYITMEHFLELKKENEVNTTIIRKKIAKLEQANKEYYMTTSYLVAIGSRASEIFSRSKPHEKRTFLNLVLQNLTLEGEKVRYKAKYPFSLVLKYAPSSAWLPR